MVIPEHIGSHDGHTTSPHLLDLAAPLSLRHSAVVYLAHDRQHALAIDDETTAVHLEADSLGIDIGSKLERILSHHIGCSGQQDEE